MKLGLLRGAVRLLSHREPSLIRPEPDLRRELVALIR